MHIVICLLLMQKRRSMFSSCVAGGLAVEQFLLMDVWSKASKEHTAVRLQPASPPSSPCSSLNPHSTTWSTSSRATAHLPFPVSDYASLLMSLRPGVTESSHHGQLAMSSGAHVHLVAVPRSTECIFNLCPILQRQRVEESLNSREYRVRKTSVSLPTPMLRQVCY